MVNTILTFLVSYWYYTSAEKVGKNPFQWLVLGAVFYFGARILWIYGVVRPFMSREFVSYFAATGVFIEISGIIVGAVCVVLIHWRFLKPN